MIIPAGERFGDWVIEKPLGDGGMGSIFLAHSVLAEDVKAAIKVLKPNNLAETEKRFVQEMRTLSGLRHPAIVQVLGGGRHEARGYLYMAMELIDGEDLHKRIGRGAIGPEEHAHIFKEVADALGYAHSKGVAHRDIKPANIMLRSDGSPVIVDFGIAVSQGQTRHTQSGMVPGTLMYLPPELFRGVTPNPMATDAYALGVVMWEAATGEFAFEDHPESSQGEQLAAVTGRKLQATAMDPGEETPAHIRQAILRTTSPDPGHRMVSLHEVRDLLGAPSTLDVPIGGAPATMDGFAVPSAPAPQPSKPKRSGLPWLLVGMLGVGVLAAGAVAIAAGGTAAYYAMNDESTKAPPVDLRKALTEMAVAQADGQSAKALKLAKTAIDDHPDDPTANLAFGQLLLADGQPQLARPFLCAALDAGLSEEFERAAGSDRSLDCDRGTGAQLSLTAELTAPSMDLDGALAGLAPAETESPAPAPQPAGGGSAGSGGSIKANRRINSVMTSNEEAVASRSDDEVSIGSIMSKGEMTDLGASPAFGGSAGGSSAEREAAEFQARTEALRAEQERRMARAAAEEAALRERRMKQMASAPPPPPEPEPEPEPRSAAPAPAPVRPAIRITTLSVGGELSEDSVRRIILAKQSSFKRCYATILDEEPGLKGALSVSITIRSDGTVSDSNISYDGIGNLALKRCILSRVQTMTFEKDYGGRTVAKWTIYLSY